MSTRRGIQVTVYLTPEQVEGLRAIHERTRVPTSVRVRDAIDAVLTREERRFEQENEHP